MCSSMDVLPPFLTAQFLDAVASGGTHEDEALGIDIINNSSNINNNGKQVIVGLTASFTNRDSFHNGHREEVVVEEEDGAMKNSRLFVPDPWSSVGAGSSTMISNNIGLFGGGATNNSILKGISSSPSNNTMNTLALSASTPTVPSLVRHGHHHHHQSLLSFVEPPTATHGTLQSPFPLTLSSSQCQLVVPATTSDIPAFIFVPVQSMDRSSRHLQLGRSHSDPSPRGTSVSSLSSKQTRSRFHYNDDDGHRHIHTFDGDSDVDAMTSSAAVGVIVQEDDVSLLADNPDEDDQAILPRSTCDVLANTGIFDEMATAAADGYDDDDDDGRGDYHI